MLALNLGASLYHLIATNWTDALGVTRDWRASRHGLSLLGIILYIRLDAPAPRSSLHDHAQGQTPAARRRSSVPMRIPAMRAWICLPRSRQRSNPGESKLIGTGIAIELPAEYARRRCGRAAAWR